LEHAVNCSDEKGKCRKQEKLQKMPVQDIGSHRWILKGINGSSEEWIVGIKAWLLLKQSIRKCPEAPGFSDAL